MYLLKLDSTNKVVSCTPAMNAPYLMRLDNSYMLSYLAIPEGHQLDEEGRSFIPPAPPRHITKLAFLQRITMAEHVAIELASIHDPSSSQQQQVMAATLRKMLQMVNAANWIDLEREDTRQLVLQIEQFGLLAAGRALEILDGTIADIERPMTETPKGSVA